MEGCFSQDSINKIKEARSKQVFTEEHRKSISDGCKGRKITEETKRKISESMRGNVNSKGRSHSKETKLKMSLAHRGKRCGKESNWWKGGITDKNKTIRNSSEYKAWRLQVFERDNYTCVKCGDRNGNGKHVELNADHIKPFCNFPELRFELNNGRTLCRACHVKTETFARNAVKVCV